MGLDGICGSEHEKLLKKKKVKKYYKVTKYARRKELITQTYSAQMNLWTGVDQFVIKQYMRHQLIQIKVAEYSAGIWHIYLG